MALPEWAAQPGPRREAQIVLDSKRSVSGMRTTLLCENHWLQPYLPPVAREAKKLLLAACVPVGGEGAL